LKLKIKAKSSSPVTEEPKVAAPTGASLVERPKPKIIVKPAAPRVEEPARVVKQAPRSVFFDDKKTESKPQEAPQVEKKFIDAAAPKHEGARLVARSDNQPANNRLQPSKKPETTAEKPRWNNDSPRAASNDFSRNNTNKKK